MQQTQERKHEKIMIMNWYWLRPQQIKLWQKKAFKGIVKMQKQRFLIQMKTRNDKLCTQVFWHSRSVRAKFKSELSKFLCDSSVLVLSWRYSPINDHFSLSLSQAFQMQEKNHHMSAGLLNTVKASLEGSCHLSVNPPRALSSFSVMLVRNAGCSLQPRLLAGWWDSGW